MNADIVNLIKLGLVSLNDGDSGSMPTMQVQYLGNVADAAVMLPYGLTSRAIPDDTLCLILNILGEEENRIAIPLSTTNRKKGLKDGEVVLENQKTGSFVYLKDSGGLDISSEGVSLDSDIDIEGDLETTGEAIIGTDLTVKEAFGCNGKSAQAAFTLAPVATNFATLLTLANSLRAALVANGIGQ